MRYATIMNLMAQMGPRIMELWNQASQQPLSTQSGASASSVGAKSDKPKPPPKAVVKPPLKAVVGQLRRLSSRRDG